MWGCGAGISQRRCLSSRRLDSCAQLGGGDSAHLHHPPPSEVTLSDKGMAALHRGHHTPRSAPGPGGAAPCRQGWQVALPPVAAPWMLPQAPKFTAWDVFPVFQVICLLLKCSRAGWTWLGASWGSGRCPRPWQQEERDGFEVPSVPNHPGIP